MPRSLDGQPFTRTYRLELSRSLGVARKRWRRSILEAARYRACASRTAGISWIPGKTGAHRARRYSSKQSPRQAGALLYVRIKPQAVRATMPFTIEDFRDLVRLLEEKPEWRAEMRRLILTDELLALPERVERGFLELTEAAKRHDEQIAEMRAEMDRRFAETDRRFRELIAEMDRRFGELIAEMDRRFA